MRSSVYGFNLCLNNCLFLDASSTGERPLFSCYRNTLSNLLKITFIASSIRGGGTAPEITLKIFIGRRKSNFSVFDTHVLVLNKYQCPTEAASTTREGFGANAIANAATKNMTPIDIIRLLVESIMLWLLTILSKSSRTNCPPC